MRHTAERSVLAAESQNSYFCLWTTSIMTVLQNVKSYVLRAEHAFTDTSKSGGSLRDIKSCA